MIPILFQIEELIDIYVVVREYEEFLTELYNFITKMNDLISVK